MTHVDDDVRDPELPGLLLRTERDALIPLLRAASEDAFALRTACPGWTVRHVISHCATALTRLIENRFEPGVFTPESNDRDIAGRAHLPISAVIDELERGMTEAGPLMAASDGAMDGLALGEWVHAGDVRDAFGVEGAYAGAGLATALDLLTVQAKKRKAPPIDPSILKLFVADPMKEAVTKAQMDMTLDVMAHSLVYWSQQLVSRGLMGRGGRIYAMTSSGGARVLPFYGPVSAAKAALESNIRQLAAELAPHGITANSIRAGVTATPAAQKIPNYEEFSQQAARRNPHRRLTTTDDVARAIVVLSHPDTHWITGNVIGVDGGEEIVG